ncbi:MAG: PAS domain S-box protein [Prolixibacteraceae bacterium]
MEDLIKILHLEDNENDSILVQVNLNRENLNYEYFLADNEADFISHLTNQKIDIILSDYSLPVYSGSEALLLVRKNYQHIPFVFVSGTMGEEAAIESLLNGAIDYVLKNKLERLGSAVRRALRESRLQMEYQTAIDKLRFQEEQYRSLVEGMNEGIMLTDNADKILFINQQTIEITGYTSAELIGKDCAETLYEGEFKDKVLEKNLLRLQGIKDKYEIKLKRKDNRQIWIRISGSPVYDNNNNVIGTIGVFENINDQKIAEDELRKLKRAVDQSPDSIIITDIDGVIEYANPATSVLTGYSNDELLGRKTNMFNSGLNQEEEYFELWETIKSGKIWTGELQNRRKNGVEYWESVSISPIYDFSGQITHFLAIMEDISERKRITQELIISKERAEESDRLKSAFLANISHEIRTPMNGILGFAELLKIPDLTSEMQERYIHVIEQSGNRMLNIINDIVDISKIEAGQMNIHLQETNVNQLLQDLHIFFTPEARTKGLSMSLVSDVSEEESVILTDRTKLTQILTNLIKNAIKFTNSGSIEFGCSPFRSNITGEVINEKTGTENTFDTFRFYVRDTGTGITPDQAELIFERFRQGSFSLSRDYEGAGLGLPISKAFVEMLGGKIWVESEFGKGSVFFFEIPKKTITSIESESSEILSEENLSHSVNLLIVEDDETSLIFLRTIMELENINLYEANNGVTAIEMVKKHPEIELVLMDMKLPVLDGFEATHRIKKIRPELPVIAQTAYAFLEDQQKAIEAGCIDFISKPVKRKVLIDKIMKYRLIN